MRVLADRVHTRKLSVLRAAGTFWTLSHSAAASSTFPRPPKSFDLTKYLEKKYPVIY